MRYSFEIDKATASMPARAGESIYLTESSIVPRAYSIEITLVLEASNDYLYEAGIWNVAGGAQRRALRYRSTWKVIDSDVDDLVSSACEEGRGREAAQKR
jgi:hypothetical protein